MGGRTRHMTMMVMMQYVVQIWNKSIGNKDCAHCSKLYFFFQKYFFRILDVNRCLFMISAVCLHFQLFVYFFEFPNKNIVFCKVFCHSRIFKSLIFSYLFTFLSAVCLLFCLHCQLIVYFFNFQEKHWKIMTFLPKIWV